MMSRRGVAHLLLAAVLHEHDLEKQPEQEELLADGAEAPDATESVLFLHPSAYVWGLCLPAHAEYCRKINYNM